MYNKPEDYHTQRNNEIDPHETCNVTAIVMGAEFAGCPVIPPEGVQAEDFMAKFLLSKEGMEKMAELTPWAVGKYKPYEVHALLAWAYNTLAEGRGRDNFGLVSKLETLKEELKNGTGVVLRGKFPHYKLGRIGHIVTMVDVTEDGIIIDDPYGNYKLNGGYNPNCKGYDLGNDIRMTNDQVIQIFNADGSGYLAHLIKKIA